MKLLALQGTNGKFFVNPEKVQQVYSGDQGWSIIRFSNGDTAHVKGAIENVVQMLDKVAKISGPSALMKK